MLAVLLAIVLGWVLHPEPAAGTDATGGIGDTVWLDGDRDGLQDADEPGVAGVTVRLLDGDGNQIDVTATDGAGRFLFDGLEAGTYRLGFEAPSGFSFTAAKVGSNPSIDSDADPATGLTGMVGLDPGEIDRSIDAGLTASGSTTSEPSSTSVPQTSSTGPPPPTTEPPSSSSTSGPSPTTTPPPTTPLPTTGPTTSTSPSTSTTLSPQDQLERLAGSLTRGSMTIDERRCGRVDVRNTAGNTRIDVECIELVADEEFFFVVSIRRIPGDGPGTGSTSTSVTDTTPPVPIETSFRMRAVLSFDPEQALIRPQGRPVETDGEAEITRDVLEGDAVTFPFAVRPTRPGELAGRLLVLAVDVEDDGLTTELAAGEVTLQVAPPLGGSTTVTSNADGTTPPTVLGVAVESGSGNVGLWMGAVGGLLLLGAIAWFSRSRIPWMFRSRRATTAATAGVPVPASGAGGDRRRVFISYSRKDAAKVDRLQEDLETAGYDTWVDRGDITGGEVWKAEIVRGIRASDVVVLVLSRNSVDSAHVAAELSLGRSHSKPVIPVRLSPDPELSDRLAYDLADLHFIDLFGDRAAGIDSLLASLRGMFGQSVAGDPGDSAS